MVGALVAHPLSMRVRWGCGKAVGGGHGVVPPHVIVFVGIEEQEVDGGIAGPLLSIRSTEHAISPPRSSVFCLEQAAHACLCSNYKENSLRTSVAFFTTFFVILQAQTEISRLCQQTISRSCRYQMGTQVALGFLLGKEPE